MTISVATQSDEDSSSMFKKELSDRLSEFSSAPVLFVGSGLSRRYLGLPDWMGLVEQLTKYTDKSFAYYRSTANGDPARIASLMINELHEKMWTPDLADVRIENEDHLINNASALKVLTAAQVTSYSLTEDSNLLEEIELMKKINIDAVVTTNFDDLIETIFPDFKTFVGQEELLISDPQGVGEIYKIHGTVQRPNSMVVSKEDFDEFSDRYAYLAAKLMTFFAEHPVIFIGYSMTDENIIDILDSLVKSTDAEFITKLQDKLIFVKRGDGYSISSTIIPTSGVQIPVINVMVPDDFRVLFEVLGTVERKFPAHILRLLKERIYELVLTNDPNGKLYVDDIENVNSESVDVVLGVGIKGNVGDHGYVTFDRLDICKDVLEGGKIPDAKSLLNKTIPPLQGVIPIIKYMLKAGYLKKDGTLQNTETLNPRILARYENNLAESSTGASVKKQGKALADAYPNFSDLAKNNDEYHTLIAISALDPANIDKDELKSYLINLYQRAFDDKNFRTYWAKAVCLYDRLQNLDQPW